MFLNVLLSNPNIHPLWTHELYFVPEEKQFFLLFVSESGSGSGSDSEQERPRSASNASGSGSDSDRERDDDDEDDGQEAGKPSMNKVCVCGTLHKTVWV